MGDPPFVVGASGRWDEETAGGCINFDTAVHNPQFLLYVREPHTDVRVTLRQDGEYPIGCLLCHKRGERIRSILKGEWFVSNGTFQAKREVQVETTLDVNMDGYTILPSTFDPGSYGSFTLTVTSTRPVSLVPLADPFAKLPISITCDGAWRGTSAGGCLNFASVQDNPQFLLNVSKPTTVRICLEQRRPDPRSILYSIGFRLASLGGQKLTEQNATDEAIVASSGVYLDQARVYARAVLDGPRVYTLLPSTFNPGEQAEFTLSIGSDWPVVLEPWYATEEAVAMTRRFVGNGEWKGITAGGCVNHATVVNNPQYKLYVTEPTRIRVILEQTVEDEIDLLDIGCVLASVGEGRLATLYKGDKLASSGSYVDAHQVTMEASVDATDSPYTILVSTFKPGDEGPFRLIVEANKPVEVRALPPPQERVALSYVETTKNSWRGLTAGGGIKFPSCVDNPQFLLQVTRETRALIKLSLSQALPILIGMHVVNNGGNLVDHNLTSTEEVASCNYTNRPEITIDVTLPASATPYTILPCAFAPGDESDFTLSVQADAPIKLAKCAVRAQPSALPFIYTLQSAWAGTKAGGCVNFPTAINNPHFFILVSQPTMLTVTLTQNDNEMTYIGMVVVDNGGNRVGKIGNNQMVASSGAYSKSREVYIKEFSLNAKPTAYTLLPSTFQPGDEARFTITIRSEEDVTVMDEAEYAASQATVAPQRRLSGSSSDRSDEPPPNEEDEDWIWDEQHKGKEVAAEPSPVLDSPREVGRTWRLLTSSMDTEDATLSSRNVPVSPVIDEKQRVGRTHAISELISTETHYVKSLQTLRDVYITPLLHPKKQLLDASELDGIFNNIDSIRLLNGQFLDDLQDAMKQSEPSDACVGRRFLNFLPYMTRFYSAYIAQFDVAQDVLESTMAKKTPFKKFCEMAAKDPQCGALNLAAFILMPVQRVPRYQLLLKEIAKFTPKSHPDAEALAEAVTKIGESADLIDDSIHAEESQRKLSSIQARFVGVAENIVDSKRRFMHEGTFLVGKTDTPVSKQKTTSGAPPTAANVTGVLSPLRRKGSISSGKQLRKTEVFLFNDAILFCSARGKNLRFENMFSLNGCSVTERDAGFFLHAPHNEEYMLTPVDMDQLEFWVRAIKKAIDKLPPQAPTTRRLTPTAAGMSRAAATVAPAATTAAAAPKADESALGVGPATAAPGAVSPKLGSAPDKVPAPVQGMRTSTSAGSLHAPSASLPPSGRRMSVSGSPPSSNLLGTPPPGRGHHRASSTGGRPAV